MSEKTAKKQLNSKNEEKYFYSKDEDELIVKSVLEDYERRKEERRTFDLIWQLNMNFVLGNQYTSILPSGEVSETEKDYSWECRDVYNHIAPIIETRLAKLNKVRPSVSVRPFSSEQSDVYCAKLSKAILDFSSHKLKLNKLISEATCWSEVCGTAFYKIMWNSALGKIIGENEYKQKIYEGDVDVCVCSPFEIFPDSNSASDVDDCASIIHARIMPADEASQMFNTTFTGGDKYAFTFDTNSFMNGFSGRSNVSKLTKSVKHDHVLVLEKHIKPTRENPNGKLIIIVENKLVYDGDMPFIISEDGKRGYPFIRQISVRDIGSFWGGSVVERCIPIQRAYNAIKNRKHEYLNRITGGVLAVEDGSVDIDDLEDDGLKPGKILVYRAGSPVPRYMDTGSVPYDFNREEDRLLSEFITVSGVSELMRDSSVPTSVTSGVALSLLIEQDETRLAVTAENIRESVLALSKMILRLYKQFANTKRLARIADDNGDIEVYYFTGTDITSQDIVLDTINELTQSPAQKRSMMLEMFKLGLFHDENGKLSDRTRYKLLEGLGFGLWDYSQDERTLQVKNANFENLHFSEDIRPSDIDNHKIHIEEHRKFMLTEEAKEKGPKYLEMLRKHIVSHKAMLLQENALNENKN
ncbi:MAG: hypothetical protein IJT25_00820 [Clostridia bacterium]|nr:hypothetical protein [Clostridia bacterium]